MSPERTKRAPTPTLMVERFLRDPATVSALLGKNNDNLLRGSLQKAERKIRCFDEVGKFHFTYLVMSQITGNPDQDVQRAAFELLRSIQLDIFTRTVLVRSAQMAISQLSKRPHITRVDADLARSLIALVAQGHPNSDEVKRVLHDDLRQVLDSAGKDTISDRIVNMFPLASGGAQLEGVDVEVVEDTTSPVLVIPVKMRPSTDLVANSDADKEEDVVSLTEYRSRPPGWKEQRRQDIQALQRTCLSLPPGQRDEMIVKMRQEGIYKNWELERIFGLSSSTLSGIISRLVEEGRIESRSKKTD